MFEPLMGQIQYETYQNFYNSHYFFSESFSACRCKAALGNLDLGTILHLLAVF
jgi:hypothetical protein